MTYLLHVFSHQYLHRKNWILALGWSQLSITTRKEKVVRTSYRRVSKHAALEQNTRIGKSIELLVVQYNLYLIHECTNGPSYG